MGRVVTQSPLRRRLLIDPPVQLALLRRIGLYSFVCCLYFAATQLLAAFLSHPDASISEIVTMYLDEAVYGFCGLVLLVPLVVYDLLHATNRIAGPIFRLRREMRDLAHSDDVEDLSFRHNDHWHDIADTFNELREELLELRRFRENASSRVNDDHGLGDGLMERPRVAPSQIVLSKLDAPDHGARI